MSKAPARSDTTEAYVRGLRRGGREALLLGAAGITIYLFMALVSYSPNDPGWSAYGGSREILNLGGVTGAWLADVMLSLFGWAGYLVPWFVLYAGWLAYRGREAHSALAVGARTTASMLLLIAVCALTTVWSDGGTRLPEGEGGIIGKLIAEIARAGLGGAGSSWFLVVLAAVSLSIATGFSWLQVAEWVGNTLFKGFTLLRPRVGDLLAKRVAPTPIKTKRSEPVIAPTPAKSAAAVPPPPAEEKPRRRRAEPMLNEPPNKGQAAQLQLLINPELPKPKPGSDPIPPLELLDLPKPGGRAYTEEELTQLSQQLERHLADFGVEARVVGAEPGPVITRFELEPAPGVKGSQISNLAKDLARSLSVTSVRVVEVIPGKSYIGLEIPNQQRELVALREILQADAYQQIDAPLALALGKDIAGHPVVVDLARMPHMLVAGTTGSGKSVAINVMILSLLFRRRPADVRLIMIDPKMLELSVYEGVPHLLTPVVTDMKEASNALRWCVAEMERRYRVMAGVGVRNLAGFNRKLEDAAAEGTIIPDPLYKPELALDPSAPPPALSTLPHIVVIVDELADMMMVVGKKVEELIARLAQKARAAGIHLILATQRPSVDVITGLIKANIPARVAFQVSSRIDSRTILDQMGAESLLGHGDMLYLPPGTGIPRRVHGAFVDDHEVHKVVGWLKQTGTAVYLDEVLAGAPEASEPGVGGENGDSGGEDDPLYDEAVKIVTESRKASISWVQRRLRIGYNRAARLVEQMESAGVVGPLEANGSRDVLAPAPPEN